MFIEVTGVERSRLGNNMLILSPGNKNVLFPSATKPGDKLIRLLLDVINATWVAVQKGIVIIPSMADIPSAVKSVFKSETLTSFLI